MGDAGAAALAAALANNTTVKTVNVTQAGIGEEGAGVLAEALAVNTALRSLNLFGNRIGDGGARALARCVLDPAASESTTVTTLNLEGNGIGTYVFFCARVCAFFFQSVFEYRFSFLFCSFFGGSLFLGLLSPFLLKPLTLNDKICSPNPRQQKYISSQQEYKQVYLYVY